MEFLSSFKIAIKHEFKIDEVNFKINNSTKALKELENTYGNNAHIVFQQKKELVNLQNQRQKLINDLFDYKNTYEENFEKYLEESLNKKVEEVEKKRKKFKQENFENKINVVLRAIAHIQELEINNQSCLVDLRAKLKVLEQNLFVIDEKVNLNDKLLHKKIESLKNENVSNFPYAVKENEAVKVINQNFSTSNLKNEITKMKDDIELKTATIHIKMKQLQNDMIDISFVKNKKDDFLFLSNFGELFKKEFEKLMEENKLNFCINQKFKNEVEFNLKNQKLVLKKLFDQNNNFYETIILIENNIKKIEDSKFLRSEQLENELKGTASITNINHFISNHDNVLRRRVLKLVEKQFKTLQQSESKLSNVNVNKKDELNQTTILELKNDLRSFLSTCLSASTISEFEVKINRLLTEIQVKTTVDFVSLKESILNMIAEIKLKFNTSNNNVEENRFETIQQFNAGNSISSTNTPMTQNFINKIPNNTLKRIQTDVALVSPENNLPINTPLIQNYINRLSSNVKRVQSETNSGISDVNGGASKSNLITKPKKKRRLSEISFEENVPGIKYLQRNEIKFEVGSWKTILAKECVDSGKRVFDFHIINLTTYLIIGLTDKVADRMHSSDKVKYYLSVSSTGDIYHDNKRYKGFPFKTGDRIALVLNLITKSLEILHNSGEKHVKFDKLFVPEHSIFFVGVSSSDAGNHVKLDAC
ncbi:hypothetical protein HDU92_004994, partial [Lobulomyces angularis]